MADRGARPYISASAVFALAILIVGVFVGIAFRDVLLDSQSEVLTYLGVALLGLLVGVAELAARYRDKPQAPFATIPGWIYVLTNAAAAALALWLIREIAGPDWINTSGFPEPVAQVFVAGFGAMAFFRSAFFTLQIDGNNVAIGPAAILQVILDAADRACDRQRAVPRSEMVREIMKGVSFARAKEGLTLYCFALMQNLSIAEQHRVTKDVDTVASSTMEDEVKAFNLGLIMLNVVGEKVLRKSVQDLGAAIRGPVADKQFLGDMAGAIDKSQIGAVIEMCGVLDPLPLDRDLDAIRNDIDQAISTGTPATSREECLIALAVLYSYFGKATLEAALVMLAR